MVTGRCLCGAVRFVVRGRLRDAIVCHCVDCRRWHGSSPAMVAARRESVEISGEISWYAAPGKPRRGFCSRCGASLFWDAEERATLTIAAGTLDPPTGVRTTAHIFTAHVGDYETPPGADVRCYSYGAPPNVAELG